MRSTMEDDNSAVPFFISMQDISKEVNPMKNEGQKEYPRRICDEEGPSTSYQQRRKLENPRYHHRSTMPTFLGEGERCRNEERNEPETHETLILYLEEYKAQSRAFKEKLTLQQFFKIKEERGSYSSNRRKRHNRFYLPTFDGSSSRNVKAWRRELDAFFILHPVAEEEVVHIAALHLLDEANDWWFGRMEHAKVTKYSDLFHKLRKEFDVRKPEMCHKVTFPE